MRISPAPIRTAINDKTAPFNREWSKWFADLHEILSKGRSDDVAVAKSGGGTRTLHFADGLYTGYTDS